MATVLCATACGRSEYLLVDSAGGTAGATSAAADDPGGEAGVEGDSTAEPACGAVPDVRQAHFYDGDWLQTVGRDLARGPDGTLYVGGTAADEAAMYLWIEAVSPDGQLQWEYIGESSPGQNLQGWVPEANDVVFVDGSLMYVGSTYIDQTPFALMGRVDPVTNAAGETRAEPGGVWYAQAGPDTNDRFVVGRDYRASEGSRVERRVDFSPVWEQSTVESETFGDTGYAALAIQDGLIVSGQRDDFGWVARYDAVSGEPQWSRQVMETATFEARSGSLSSLALSGDTIVAGGEVYLEKPDPRDGSGSLLYTEAQVTGWSLQGDALWSWQRPADVARKGTVQSVAVGPDGTVYVAGEEGEFDDDESLFVAAFSPGGDVLWTMQDGAPSYDTVGLRGDALVVGEDNQLFVLSNQNLEAGRTTVLLEICM